MCHFISEEIEEFLSFALFEKQNAFLPAAQGAKNESARGFTPAL